MQNPVDELNDGPHHGVWVAIDVVMTALDVKRSKAFALAKSEQWRTAPGTHPKQYSFTDVHTTYLKRKASPK
ncbi:hypothetical protein [Glaciihabitans sp. dw_435]|uniref:hypothetical protein n=1 Tax=Glaciihabitans sp. dw_435 TaxID=2720081 RepID=UPI001BD5215C|nr:hypothetical protein [Glaciihabitans sp. dw_435]